jgi:hypothetical protein
MVFEVLNGLNWKKGVTWLLFSMGLCSNANGQSKLPAYRFSTEILADLAADTLPWKYQVRATELSFGGHYRELMVVWDQAGYRQPGSGAADSVLMAKSKLRKAQQYILEQAQNASVLIVNEAHHVGAHRGFTQSLLAGLYEQGYRYLGLEALYDSSINERGFAVQESGYYTRAPEFGELIYEALQLGFELFGYEAGPDQQGPEREQAQAENILQFMQSHPAGKVLIHCGYAHAFENAYKPWGWAMAGRLKTLTGIDPLTVDQTMLLERALPEHNPWLMRLNPRGQPVVLLDSAGQPYRGEAAVPQTDIVVVHPRTYFLHGRPTWWIGSKKEHWLQAEDLGAARPLMLLAYREGEAAAGGVPADVVECLADGEIRPLLLAPGTYEVLIQNQSYETIRTLQIRIDD